MSAGPLISVVVPTPDSDSDPRETIASAESQTLSEWELIVVGASGSEAVKANPSIRLVPGPDLGKAAALNAGFRAAQTEFVLPVEAGDRLDPELFAICVEELRAPPRVDFCYSDWRLLDDDQAREPGDYDLYRLLDENFPTSRLFLRKTAWERAGGYDERLEADDAAWSFALALAEHGCVPRYVRRPLLHLRRDPRRRGARAERDDAAWARMIEKHPDTLSPEGRLNVKRVWRPSICVVAWGGRAPDLSNQTLRDHQILMEASEAEALERSRAPAFLWLEGGRELRPQALEECVWALRDADWATWRDTGDAPPPSLKRFAGPLGVSRRALGWPEPKRGGAARRLPWPCRGQRGPRPGPRPEAIEPATLAGILAPSDLDPTPEAVADPEPRPTEGKAPSIESWLRHPLRSASSALPPRVKGRLNQAFGREVFDLSQYLKNKPESALIKGVLVERLEYIGPRRDGRRRVGLITAHLGFGGAEAYLLELARRIDRERAETVLIAARSNDSRWAPQWRETVDWIYDAEKLTPADQVPRLIYSIALNWEFDVLITQRSATAYWALPALKRRRPGMKAADIVRGADGDAHGFSAPLDVADALDRRVALSGAGRRRLEGDDGEDDRVRLIPPGVDLDRFRPGALDRAGARQAFRIPEAAAVVAFLGRLDEEKRPTLLVEIAKEMRRLSDRRDWGFLVAGAGPEENALRGRVDRAGLTRHFRLPGHRAAEEVLAAADILVSCSTGEYLPLVVVEALAAGTPVVACRNAAIEEAAPPNCGILVEPGPYEETRLAEAVLELLNDGAKRLAMGRAARAVAERNHDIERTRRQYDELLRELIDP